VEEEVGDLSTEGEYIRKCDIFYMLRINTAYTGTREKVFKTEQNAL
jgi:hypothetical protein